MPKQYEIRFSPEREKRGLKAWGVFEIEDAEFSRCVSDHTTMQEALKAKADLEGKVE